MVTEDFNDRFKEGVAVPIRVGTILDIGYWTKLLAYENHADVLTKVGESNSHQDFRKSSRDYYFSAVSQVRLPPNPNFYELHK